MRNPLQAIVSFNEKAGLLKDPFNDKKESAYLIEEALESFDVSYLGRLICLDPSKIDSPKEVARGLIANTLPLKEPLAKEHIVDKYLDAIVYASIRKNAEDLAREIKRESKFININEIVYE